MPRNRRGPGLLRSAARTTARTAAISATATATSRSVNNAIDQKAARTPQEQVVFVQTQDVEQMKAQLAAVPSSTAVPAPQTDLLAQLTQLAQLKETGVLSDAEFQLAKAKLLS